MKEKTLQPDQIIVPGEYELGNEAILKIYFRIFDKGHGKDLPPVITTTIGNPDKFISELEEYLVHWEDREKESIESVNTLRQNYKTLFSILEKTPYLLIDGNHKSAAATLAHSSLSALELQNDDDIEEVRRMIEKGELFEFNREETSLHNLRRSFIGYCLEINAVKNGFGMGIPLYPKLKYTKTVKERVNELTSNGDLPQYMIDRYLKDE